MNAPIERWTEDRLRTVIAARVLAWVPNASIERSLEVADRVLKFFADSFENGHSCSLSDIIGLMNDDATACYGYCQED